MEKSNNISLDNSEICRLCLTHDGLMRPIFDADVTEQPENCLPFRIKSCLSLKLTMSDRLPSKICHRCLFKVDMFFEFRVMCLNTENTLKEKFSCSEDESENILESIDRRGKDLVGTYGSVDEFEDPRDSDKCMRAIDVMDGSSNSALMNDRTAVAEPYLDSSEEISTEEVAEELKCEVSLIDIKGENSEGESDDSVGNKEDQHSLEDQERPLGFNESSYSCQDCWKPFSLLSDHRHSPNREHSFACELCPSTFDCSSQLVNHHSSKHKQDGSRERSLKCSTCGRNFSDPNALSRHMHKHSEQVLFFCGFCPRAFNQHSMLTAHIGATHLEDQLQGLEHHRQQQEEQPQEQQLVPVDVARRGVGDSLDQCDKVSPPANAKRKRFTCQLCMKTFSDSYTLQRHGRTHTGERPYPCSVCGKTFSRSWSLARHDLLHTGERPHSCPLCGKRFADRSHLLRHVRTHGRAAAAAESALRAK